jgi:aspartyl-tRNA(Asn)/glutamyl-tRNA(Gln) amidotransferase subunit B
MEEDAAKNTHVGGDEGRLKGANGVLINYNRGGVPLIEIVTYPILNTGKNAALITKNYVQTIKDLVTELKISDAKMEEGSLRADINISLRKKVNDIDKQNKIPFGIRSETKNVNSFKTIEKTVLYEIERQAKILDENKIIIQETRHFQNNKTVSGRVKSDADDYRYFSEPDLVIYSPSNELVEELKNYIPENPVKKRIQLQKEWNFSDLEMRDILNLDIVNLIEKTVKKSVSAKNAKKWWEIIISLNGLNKVKIKDIVLIEKLIKNKTINNEIGKEIINYIIKGKGNTQQIIKKYNLKIVQNNDDLEKIIINILKSDKDVLNKLQNNNMKVMGVVIGKVMKETKGKADVSLISKITLNIIKNYQF